MDNERGIRATRREDIERYVRSCRTEFWKRVMREEADYLARALAGSTDVLSVGCGTAIIEGRLSERGFRVIGLDVSREALDHTPQSVGAVAARAEDMPFLESSFDAVIYVVSLQFIEDYRRAIEQTARVLRPGGELIVMLLNPQSSFFKRKLHAPGSYVGTIRHAEVKGIEHAVSEIFAVRAEHFLGVDGDTTFESREATEAALYVIRGVRRLDRHGEKA
jgi:ubiquinone/menaquinone biosynthesis C-methylase UbiE